VKTQALVVAVVINRDAHEHLQRSLYELGRLEPGCTAVIVADDASTDASVATARRYLPEAHILEADRRIGPAAVRNLGIDYAERHLVFDYYFFLDSDAFVDTTTLSELLSVTQADPAVGIAVPKAYSSRRDKRLHLAGELEVDFRAARTNAVGEGEIDEGQYDEQKNLRACSGFAMLVRRQVVRDIGGFDEAFFPPAWEDVDFAIRARKAGYGIVYAPRATVEHVGGRLGRGLLAEREFGKVKNWLRLMRKHGSPADWVRTLLVVPVRSVEFMVGWVTYRARRAR
jgi:GT2 family glycosyltransferase